MKNMLINSVVFRQFIFNYRNKSLSMKKRQFFVGAAMMLASISGVAQSSNNVDKVVKIDRHAAQEYRQGEMIVKFKPTSEVRVRSLNRSVSSGVSAVDRVFGELGITAGEQLMPLTGDKVTSRARALRSVSGKTIEDSDMSLLYRLTFDAQALDVHQAVEKVAALDEVEYAEPNYVVYALQSESEITDYDVYSSEPLYSEQWGNGQLKLNFLWKQPKITDKRPVIAILDTGVDITHPDLVDNIWTNEAELNGADDEDDDANGFADDLHGWDFVNQTARLGDWNGHGTHCAGIAAAVGNNKIGISGANPDALIMPVTVMQSDGTGDVATIIKGIDYAAANGADVISMSIGGYNYSLAEEQALAKAYNTAVLVAAAGNDNKCIYAHFCPVNKRIDNGPMFPAAFTFVLGVEASMQNGSLAPFSNFDEDGPVFSQYDESKLYNYELRAPGASIMSTYPGGKYKKLSGTSMACPHVAGGISRLLQCKEYSNWEILFGDLIHTRKENGYANVDFEAAYKITDADRTPSLGLVTYTLDDVAEGDGDSRADAGETMAFYPTLRNEWGQAKNIRFSLELGENEDPTILDILDNDVDFGKQLSSYAKNISANPVRFKVSPDCADGRRIGMVLRASCDDIAEELVQEITLTVENGIELGGILSENMTLYPNVHYIVTRNFAVQKGAVLTIKPGSILKFRSNIEVIFPTGTINCIGTPDSMIVFTMADNETGYVDVKFSDNNEIIDAVNTYQYTWFKGLRVKRFERYSFVNCIIEDCLFDTHMSTVSKCLKCNIINSSTDNPTIFQGDYIQRFEYSNFVGNYIGYLSSVVKTSPQFYFSNSFGNSASHNGIDVDVNYHYYRTSPFVLVPSKPNYLGSARVDIIRRGLFDMENSIYSSGFGVYDLSNTLVRPSSESHGIIWKVVVNGYDAQDEFEQLPPLGVGQHKFEVYFNRPMNKEVAPVVAMGVRPPYTSHTIAEEGGWNEEGTIYTAYLTITGKTNADGLNRIYVAGAEDDEFFEIPIENMRFNVEVAAAGSMATGLMAEAGLGKVTLTWETDEEDFEDLLGYNMYRFTMDDNGVSSDSIIVNPTIIDSEETSFVDYDVVPGTTYYYVIKQLTTSLSSHALSNAVAATPLTASKGDANGSMSVDIADVVTEVAYITYQDPQPFIFEAADVNEDAKVNVLDVVGTIGIITNPAGVSVSGIDNEPVRYYVTDGILYVETAQALGGVQVRLDVAKGAEITALDGLAGMEQTGTWMSDSEYLFLAYSMSGRSIPAGTHALLQIGNEAIVTEMVLSDTKGKNITAVNADATGIGKVEAVQLQMPSPNPFTTVLHVPYTIGKSGSHEVTITFKDMAGRTIDAYHTVNTQGEYTYTWYPRALQKGLYLVSLYLDGELMQTVKVIKN